MRHAAVPNSPNDHGAWPASGTALVTGDPGDPCFPLQSGMPPASAPCAPAQPRRRHCLTLGLAGWLADGLSGSAAQAANVPVIRYPAPQSPLDTRSLDLISLLDTALRRTEAARPGPPAAHQRSADRAAPVCRAGCRPRHPARDLGHGVGRASDPAKAIPFDARHGLLGLRIALVDERRLPDIAKIRDLAALQRLTIGQGLAWPDVDVLRASGIKGTDGVRLREPVPHADGRPLDLFPRGVGEVFDEYEARHAQMPRLAIDPHLLLVYPYPYQYYFAPSQSALAARVEKACWREGGRQLRRPPVALSTAPPWPALGCKTAWRCASPTPTSAPRPNADWKPPWPSGASHRQRAPLMRDGGPSAGPPCRPTAELCTAQCRAQLRPLGDRPDAPAFSAARLGEGPTATSHQARDAASAHARAGELATSISTM